MNNKMCPVTPYLIKTSVDKVLSFIFYFLFFFIPDGKINVMSIYYLFYRTPCIYLHLYFSFAFLFSFFLFPSSSTYSVVLCCMESVCKII